VEKTEDAVFAGVHPRIQRGPRARRPRWNLGFERAARTVLADRIEGGKGGPARRERLEDRLAGRIESNEQYVHRERETIPSFCISMRQLCVRGRSPAVNLPIPRWHVNPRRLSPKRNTVLSRRSRACVIRSVEQVGSRYRTEPVSPVRRPHYRRLTRRRTPERPPTIRLREALDGR